MIPGLDRRPRATRRSAVHAWRRFGELPAVPVVGALYAVVGIAHLAFGADSVLWTWPLGAAVLLPYCLARGRRLQGGYVLVFTWSGPQLTEGALVALGGYRSAWTAAPGMLIALIGLWIIDRRPPGGDLAPANAHGDSGG